MKKKGIEQLCVGVWGEEFNTYKLVGMIVFMWKTWRIPIVFQEMQNNVGMRGFVASKNHNVTTSC